MFSNHTNINILGSTIDKAETQLSTVKVKPIENELTEKDSYDIDSTKLQTAASDSEGTNKKLNFQIINYKKQQIL